MPETIPMTAEDLKRLRSELDFLKTQERPRIREELAHARSFGDFSENAELDEAKRDYSTLEGRIAQLEATLSRVVVIDTSEMDQVAVGASVVVLDLSGKLEFRFNVRTSGADPAEGIVVTPDSPIGKGLIGKRVDDEVQVTTPAGMRAYRILAVEFGS